LADDLSAPEMYEILRMPVIRLPPQNLHHAEKRAVIRFEILARTYLPGILFIYLFSGGKWNYYLNFWSCLKSVGLIIFAFFIYSMSYEAHTKYPVFCRKKNPVSGGHGMPLIKNPVSFWHGTMEKEQTLI
jgi:hypothetical protein